MKKLLCIILTVALMIPSYLALAFDDVASDHWAKEYIDTLSEKGIINGYEDKTFRPEGNVTRAEFAKILALSLELSDEGVKFDDMKEHWAEKYASVAGSVMYKENSAFMPNVPITRAEIAYALAGALCLDDAKKSLDEMFTDSDSVDKALWEKTASSVEAGLVEGYENGEIRGGNPVTRAEACALIVRAVEYKENDEEEKEEVKEEEEEKENNQETEKDPSADDSSSQAPENNGLEHIYSLVPAKDLILVTSVTKTMDEKTMNDAVRITYTIAGDDTQYSSVITDDGDIDVIGARTSLGAIKKGDVLITDSGFLRHIDRIFVLCALGETPQQGSHAYIPEGSKIGPRGSGKKYELIAGKVTDRKSKEKAVVLTLENGEIVSIPRKANVSLYHPMLKTPWESASPTAIYSDAVIFARYTDGVVTDAVAAIYE